MKKLISVIMTIILVVSTTIMGFAENIILENTKTGITINEVHYTDSEFREILESIEFVGESQNTKSTRIVPAIAIPAWAIGTWVVPVAGTIITVIVAPRIMKVGGKVIDSTSQTFKNILDAIKESRKSEKEKSTDIPSWAKGEKPKKGESGNEFAKRLMDKKYGKGNYNKGPGSEYNKLRKYGDRVFK